MLALLKRIKVIQSNHVSGTCSPPQHIDINAYWGGGGQFLGSDLKTLGYNGSNELKFMHPNWKSSRPLNYFAKGVQKNQKSAIFSKRFLSEIFFGLASCDLF